MCNVQGAQGIFSRSKASSIPKHQTLQWKTMENNGSSIMKMSLAFTLRAISQKDIYRLIQYNIEREKEQNIQGIQK
jgi:hypothetical protein